MYKSAKLVSEALTRHEVKNRVSDINDLSVVEAVFLLEKCPDISVLMFARDDDNYIAIRVFNLVKDVPEEKMPEMLKVCNKLNGKYNYFCFYVDEQNSVTVKADIPADVGDVEVGEACYALMIGLLQTIQESYGPLMLAMYA